MLGWKALLVSIVFIGQVMPAFSQRLKAKSTAGGIGFMEFLPPDYAKSNKKHPLIIFLHGIGERGNGTTELRRVVMWNTPVQMAESGHNMTFTVDGQEFSFIVLAPQLSAKYRFWPATYIDQVVEHAKKHYRIDESRIYITGLSLGGGGAWDYAAAFPHKVAAIVPVCGASSPNAAKVNALATHRVAVWATHGTADRIVFPAATQNWIAALNKQSPSADMRPRMTLYEGGDHFIWGRTYSLDPATVDPQSPDMHIYEWMLRHRKNNLVAAEQSAAVGLRADAHAAAPEEGNRSIH